GFAPADATHRAVNDDTFSSWSAQRMSAARRSIAAYDTRNAQCRRKVSSTVFATFGDSTAIPVNTLRIHHPVQTTERAFRSKANKSRATTSNSIDCARAVKDLPTARDVTAKWPSVAGKWVSNEPSQISEATSWIDRECASSHASYPR